MKRLLCAALSALLLLTCQTAFAGRLEVDLSVDGTPVSDMLYGAFYEDINFAADGGLYAELLRNRSFENRSLTSPKSSDSFTSWMFNHLNRAEGTVTRMTEGGLNDNNTTYMRVSVESGAYRVVNFGYSTVIGRAGIPLDEGAEYGFYCFLRSADFSGRISAALTTVGGSPLSDAIELTPSGEWQKLSGVF
ncbi:MAG: hypothetical protein PHU22_05635, partial [Eubacteriales bacterium]|nr:hypothetical protein [Eubacteriales bacterium]